MKNVARILGLMVAALVMVACSSHAKWCADDMSAFSKGKTTVSEVRDRLGEPDARSMDANGNQVWVFKKPSDSSANTLVKIGSFGMMGGKNSAAYSDILTVSFQNNIVSDVKYEEMVSILSGR